MKNSCSVIKFFLIAVSLISYCRAVDYSRYFPLAIGNTWNFATYGSERTEIVITDTVAIDGNRWHIRHKVNTFINQPAPDSYDTLLLRDYHDTVRIDSDGKIYEYGHGRSWIFFNLGGAPGTDTSSNTDYGVNDTLLQTTKVYVTHSVPAGTYDSCIYYYSNLVLVEDDEHGGVFAPDVGMIEEFGQSGAGRLESYAITGNGSSAGVIEKFGGFNGDPPSRRPTVLRPDGSGYVLVNRLKNNNPQVRLFSIDGRRMENIQILKRGTTALAVPMSSLSSGTYILTIGKDPGSESVPIIIHH